MQTKDLSRLQLVAAAAGSIVESFDWLLYAVLAPYFSHAIFPGSNPAASLLATYLIFAVGFVIRPVGAVIMGQLTDRKGRRFGLITSVVMISASSLVIAVTPGYETIGIGSAVVLVLARLVQGLSMSGELAAATAYIFETAPAQRRYLYGAIASAANYVGQMLATLCLAVLLYVFGSEGLSAGAWRVGFLVAALLGCVALWIRRVAPESAAFIVQGEKAPHNHLPLLLARKRQVLSIFLMIAPATMGLYFVTTFLATYLALAGVATKAQVSAYIPVFTCYLIFIIVLSGWLADRFSALRIVRFGHAALALLTVPIIIGMATGAVSMVPGVLLYLTLLGFVTGPFQMISPQLFPPAVRAVGVGVPAMVAVTVFGGTFPLIAESLVASDNATLLPWYIGLGTTLGLAGSLLIRRADLLGASEAEDLRRHDAAYQPASRQLEIQNAE